MAIDDTELDHRLAANRRADLVIKQVTLHRLADSARAAARKSRRLRFGAAAIAGVIALGTGAIAAPAAAERIREFLAESGWNPPAGGEVLSNSGWVNESAPDLRDYIESIYPKYVMLAPGQTHGQVVDDVQAIYAQSNALTQEVSIRRSIELASFCGWTEEWLDADARSEKGRAERAAAAMLETTTWPALKATDGEGIVEMQVSFANAAKQGKRAIVLNGQSANVCLDWVTPGIAK